MEFEAIEEFFFAKKIDIRFAFLGYINEDSPVLHNYGRWGVVIIKYFGGDTLVH